MATYWENSCSFGLRYVSWYKYLIVSLVFSHLGFWSGNLFLIAPFPDLCLLVPFSKWYSPKPTTVLLFPLFESRWIVNVPSLIHLLQILKTYSSKVESNQMPHIQYVNSWCPTYLLPPGSSFHTKTINIWAAAWEKGTRRQRSGRGAIRKRFPLQIRCGKKTKLTIRYLYHENTSLAEWAAIFPIGGHSVT